jgi:hypothetical protein
MASAQAELDQARALDLSDYLRSLQGEWEAARGASA